ncbi:hypothetical protein D3C71_1707560 [compost metagenome]
MHIHLLMRQIEIAHRRHSHHGKGLVDFEQIDILRRPSGFFKQLFHRPDGSCRKFGGRIRMGGLTDNGHQR